MLVTMEAFNRKHRGTPMRLPMSSVSGSDQRQPSGCMLACPSMALPVCHYRADHVGEALGTEQTVVESREGASRGEKVFESVLI